jgi:4-amino-4-deoxy-L-arabinose transferase-like glycosyltransferase
MFYIGNRVDLFSLPYTYHFVVWNSYPATYFAVSELRTIQDREKYPQTSNQEENVMTKLPTLNENALNIRRIVISLGFLLVLIGQYWIFVVPVDGDKLPLLPIFLSLAGVILFMVGSFIPKSPALKAKIGRIVIPQSVMWIVTAVIFSALTVFSLLLFMKYGKSIYLPVLTTWFASGIFYIYAFRSGFPTLARIKSWFKDHKIELLIIGGITLLAAFLRLYRLGVYPRVIDGDEGLLGQFAQSTISGQYANPFALWENFGGLYLQAVYLAIRVFGANPFALRILPAISGILAIPALYLFARQIAGKRVAMLSAFLLAFSHTHINFSRIGSVGYIHSTWLVPLELYLLLAGLEKRKSWMAAAGGALLAIHFSIYLSSQIVGALILVFMLIALIFMRRWFLPGIRQAAAFWGGFAIMILPELTYIIKNPTAFFDRLSQNGTFQTGWLAQTVANTGQNSIQVLAGRVVHAFLSLIYYPAVDFYGSNVPMLTLFTAVFFLAGLGLALLRVRKPGMLLLNGYFWAATLAVGIFSIPPSADSYRMLIALPAALILAAIAFDELLEFIGVGWKSARNVYAFITTGLLISLAIFNLWAYFGDFVGQCRYGSDLTSRFASYLGSYTKTVEQGSHIYLLSNDIYFYGSHASASFLSEGRKITNISDPVDSFQGVIGDTLIASPDRITELEAWAHAHPGGQTNFVYDCKTLILLSYHLP